MPLAVELSAEPLAPEEAVALLEEAGVVDAETYYAQAAELREVSFTLSRVARLATMARIKQQLLKVIAEGGTLADFSAWLDERGLVWSRWYAELVYRNAVNTAYSRARWLQMSEPHIKREFPALLYDAINDSRTSEICLALDGRWWWREDFPAGLYPPNHHACRSVLRLISKARAGKLKNPTAGTPPGAEPDPGWNHNPATDWQSMLRRKEAVLGAYLEAA